MLLGSWLAIVRGFAGLQILERHLYLAPVLPKEWTSYSFKVNYRKNTLHVRVGQEIQISLTAGDGLRIQVYGQCYELKPEEVLKVGLGKE